MENKGAGGEDCRVAIKICRQGRGGKKLIPVHEQLGRFVFTDADGGVLQIMIS